MVFPKRGRTEAVLGGMLGLVCVLLLTCCPNLARRTSPPASTTWNRVSFADVGWVRFSSGTCEIVDHEQLAEGFGAAFREFAEAYPDRLEQLRLDGLYLYGDGDPHTKLGLRVNGLYRRSKRLIIFRCGSEMVVRHELRHYYCRELDLPCNCREIEHPGGVDIHCRPRD